MKQEFNSFLKVLTVVVLAKQGRDYGLVNEKVLGWALDSYNFISQLDYRRLKGLNFEKYANSFGDIIQALKSENDFSKFSHNVEAVAEWLEENRKRGMWSRLVELSIDQTTFLDYLRKILLPKGSESSERWLEQKVNFLKEPNLTKCFAGDLEEEYEHNKELPPQLKGKSDKQIYTIISNISKMLPGNKEVPPFLDPQKQAREEEPGKFAIWQAGRDYLQIKAKKTIAKIVRTYGDTSVTSVPVLPIKTLKQHIKNSDIIWPTINPNLNRGELVDDALVVYTKSGLSLGRSVPYTAEIEYNENYVEDYTNKFDQGKGGMYYLKLKTTSSQGFSNLSPTGRARSNKKATFEKVNDAAGNIESHRKAWVAKLKAKNSELRMAATIIEIVYQTAIRIGSKIGAAKSPDGKEHETYGLTVLKKKNAKLLTGRIKLHYIGKAAQEQTQFLIRKKDHHYDQAIDNVEHYLEGKKPEDFIFTYVDANDGKTKRFTSTKANYYLNEVFGVPKGVSIHKFRHIKANTLAMPILESSELLGRKDNTVKSVLAWLNEHMKVVGEELGHFKEGEVVGTTAIASYIDPLIVKSFFEQCKVQVPKQLAKLLDENE